jgi:hypothetical protein
MNRYEQFTEDRPNGQDTEQEKRPRFTAVFDDELIARPRPPQIINGMYSANSIGMLYGASGSGKTFVALDQGLSVQNDDDWVGLPVTQGRVVYVCGEGTGHFPQRIAAWKLSRGVPLTERLGAIIVEQPVMMGDPFAVADFIDIIQAIDEHPAFIVLDTLARCACGLNENDQRDMGLFINSCEVIREKTKCCVLILHHPNRVNGTERGSSVLRASCDTVLALEADGTALTLKTEKQKDGACGNPINLVLEPVRFVVSEAVTIDTCIVAAGTPELTESERKAMQVLEDCFGDEGATQPQWRDVCESEGLKRASFYRAATSLKRKKHVIEDGDKWVKSRLK